MAVQAGVYQTVYILLLLKEMENPFKQTVEFSKQEKLKLLNQKLNNMLQHRQVDPNTLTSKTIQQIQPSQSTNSQPPPPPQPEEEDSHKPKHNKNKIIRKEEHKPVRNLRKAAGEVWDDKTMQDWPQNGYRIFCGNLGNQVSDDILGTVFRRYSSFQMARVVRDRRTGKTRGYGFVSLANPNDFLSALKEMNGQHVGNRPVKLSKSSWKDRQLTSLKNQGLPSDFKKNAQKTTHQICLDYKFVSSL